MDDAIAKTKFNYVIGVVKAIRSVRSLVKLSPKVKPVVYFKFDAWVPIQETVLEDNLAHIMTLCNVQKPKFTKTLPETGCMSQFANNNVFVYVKVGPFIDLQKEVFSL